MADLCSTAVFAALLERQQLRAQSLQMILEQHYPRLEKR
jgi:hypothetical protein